MKNRKNNKGFSLVELIIVVAIMAVLVGILAPAYLKYVENSRISKDETNAEEFRHAVEVAITEEDIYLDLEFTGSAIVITIDEDDTSATGGTCDELLAELANSIGTTNEFTSKKYSTTDLQITIGTDYKVTANVPDPSAS